MFCRFLSPEKFTENSPKVQSKQKLKIREMSSVNLPLNFKQLTNIVVGLPLFGFGFCVLWSFLFNYEVFIALPKLAKNLKFSPLTFRHRQKLTVKLTTLLRQFLPPLAAFYLKSTCGRRAFVCILLLDLSTYSCINISTRPDWISTEYFSKFSQIGSLSVWPFSSTALNSWPS